jgi:hypothetical protein
MQGRTKELSEQGSTTPRAAAPRAAACGAAAQQRAAAARRRYTCHLPPMQAPMAGGQMQQQQQQQSMTVVVQTDGGGPATHKNIDVNDLTLCSAFFCCNTALYTSSECVGCSGKGQFCCLQSENCCKLGGNLGCGCNGQPDDCCVCRCFCCSYGIVTPSTFCLGQQHCCCFVTSNAFPTTEDVPCMCTFCLPGLVICPKVGCCKTIGDIKGNNNGGSTTTVMMSTQQQSSQQGYAAMGAIDMER